MSKRTALALLLAPVLWTGVSCVLPDQIESLRSDVAGIRDEMSRVRAEQEAASKRLRAVETTVSSADPVKREEFAALRADLDEVRRRGEALDARIDETQRRMDRLSLGVQTTQEMARRPVPTVPPPTTPPTTDPGAPPPPPAGGTAAPNPEALYNTAYSDFSKGNYDLAVGGFEEYASRYPESDLADNALYWIGECRFSQGSYTASLEAFDRMLARHPRSDKAAAANLKKALAYLEMNQVAQAIVQMKHVVDTYPASDEARVARDRLAALGAPTSRP